ncbi:MAG: carbamoyl-phosphate synthase (glutamine-hydrolyzing) large subunit, partial [Planctomycetota bacterium]
GQTALNCGMELLKNDVFHRYRVRILGTPIQAIQTTEDRKAFVESLTSIGLKVPESSTAVTIKEAEKIAEKIGYPVMVRIAFALGGLGSGICTNVEELRETASRGLAHASQILVEEYLSGWKEVEYEVVRDRFDNCITVCNMENFDPMGIHTGESIVVAPSQTLSNREYHKLRRIAIQAVRHLGIVGECNIQYALDPKSEEYRIIEVNARLSRSSALASKATGYPLAFVAAKLALGYSLPELRNSVTHATTACFEPALDYVVVKMPRWDLKKFKRVSNRIGSGMKSVGEVMAIGRKFEEALQKALRMLEIGVDGLVANENFRSKNLEDELCKPTDQRALFVPEALKRGYSIGKIHDLSNIDPWFLHKIENIVNIEEKLRCFVGHDCPIDLLRTAKQHGFSDRQISRLLERSEASVREQRRKTGVVPRIKRIDTLAAEYPAKTNYLYLTYNGDDDDVEFGGDDKPIVVLGSGAYRIGSSVEFDWCCVNAVKTLRALGRRAIMINYNPETVSTDYDECDRLYFDELSFETVMDICDREGPEGVIISMGGQIPNTLAMRLFEAGVHIMGTHPQNIDRAEDRHKFSKLLDELGVDQPEWNELVSPAEAIEFARRVGYPVLVRPSYVLSGAAMSVASNDTELIKYLDKAVAVSDKYPIVISKFIEAAKEIEMDAVARNGTLVIDAISEHMEFAGVHSGDATIVLPPQRTYLETTRRIKMITRKIAAALKIHGPFNMQFVAKENDVKVIECNLRASRSFPFVSKIYRHNFIDIATRVIMGEPVPDKFGSVFELEYVGVKAPQFSFTRLDGADPTLGVEMASTGEVGCLGDDFEEAFLKALLSVGYRVPIRNVLLSTGPIESKAQFLAS